MSIVITPEEVRNYGVDADDEMIAQVISDAIDQAELIAPGVSALDDATSRAVAAVIRGAVARYLETASNAEMLGGRSSMQDSAGPFSHQDTFRERTAIFLPSEERKIAMAVQRGKRRVFAMDLAPAPRGRRCGVCVDECLGEWPCL